jgi:hypothetical protein
MYILSLFFLKNVHIRFPIQAEAAGAEEDLVLSQQLIDRLRGSLGTDDVGIMRNPMTLRFFTFFHTMVDIINYGF